MNKTILTLDARELRSNYYEDEGIKESFRDNGIIIINNLLSHNECDLYIDLLEEKYEKYRKHYYENKIKDRLEHSGAFAAKFVDNLHNKDVKFLRFLDDPRVLNFVRCLLQQGSFMNSGEIICAAFTARSTLCGSEEQQLHNDTRITGLKYPLIVNAIWTLDPFRKDNGATRVLVGSQQSDSYPESKKTYKNEVIVEAPKGSAIIFNGALWHGASAVTSSNANSRRWAIICSYARWFCRPSYDFQKNTPKPIYKQMNNVQKDLMGFRFNPPKDEFTGNRSIQASYKTPSVYKLPK